MYKLTCIGNLTNEPELKKVSYTTKEGEILENIPVVHFTVAGNNGHGKDRTTIYLNVTAWRGQATNCATYLKKGSKVYVEGPLKVNNFIDKGNNIRSNIEMRADEIIFLDKAPASETEYEEEALY